MSIAILIVIVMGFSTYKAWTDCVDFKERFGKLKAEGKYPSERDLQLLKPRKYVRRNYMFPLPSGHLSNNDYSRVVEYIQNEEFERAWSIIDNILEARKFRLILTAVLSAIMVLLILFGMGMH